MSIQASCLCGTLRYEVDGPFTLMLNCHCSMCRKHHGAPFATLAEAPLAGFRWLSGEHALERYTSSPGVERSFCTVCGSVGPSFMPEAGLVVVPAGTLDADPGIRPSAHMFVGSRAPWHTISDGLPQYEEYSPRFGTASPIPRPSVHAPEGKTLGSCLCGDIAYEIAGPPGAMYQCHCSRCRKARSAAHGANLFYKPEQFRWIRGEAQVVSYALPQARRFAAAFCKRCGGSVPRVSVEHGMVVAPAGALDTDPHMTPLAHIFVGSKAEWFEITDALAQFSEMPPR